MTHVNMVQVELNEITNNINNNHIYKYKWCDYIVES
jgi:hypothetical protein